VFAKCSILIRPPSLLIGYVTPSNALSYLAVRCHFSTFGSQTPTRALTGLFFGYADASDGAHVGIGTSDLLADSDAIDPFLTPTIAVSTCLGLKTRT